MVVVVNASKPVGAVCCWEWTGAGRCKDWSLLESFPIDKDGRRCDGKGDGERLPWVWLMNRLEDPEDRSSNLEAIPGRCVTLCTLESGIRLVEFNLPVGCDWLGIHFASHVCKGTDWTSVIQGGYRLFTETATAARSFLFSKPNPSAPEPSPESHRHGSTA